MRVKPYTDQTGKRLGYSFDCPGCGGFHAIPTEPGGSGPVWGFNNNTDKPTFSPSLLVRGTIPVTDDEVARIMAGEKVLPQPFCCHSFIVDGAIQFLGDCTHALKGRTVPLTEIAD
jgi:hypothetical protein